MMIVDSKLVKGLPKKTQSLCPECVKKIDAELVEKDGKVMMFKRCPEHGEFEDVIWSDVSMYLKAEQWAYDGIGIENPYNTKPADKIVCPDDCGMCLAHTSHTSLALVDITNRCNLTCPICFANANASGVVYEPTFDEIKGMLKRLREMKPIAAKGIQFSGGEPTIRPDFLEILKAAKEMGFSQIQVATNGIRFAEDPSFADQCQLAGLHTLYLQFDGLDDVMYRSVRGHKMSAIKRQAVENVRNTPRPKKMSIVLVPTIVNGVNDHLIGDILQFAVDNIDVVHSVNFQPVSFSGRISKKNLQEQRFTLSDLPDRIEKQTGWLTKDDFYPVPAVAILSDLIALLKNEPKVAFTTHPHCGISTFLFVDKDKNVYPVTKLIDVERMFNDARSGALKIEHSRIKTFTRARVGAGFLMSTKFGSKYIRKENLPEGLDLHELIKPLFDKGDKSALSKFTWNALMVGGMHFMDLYNYDVERVKRCGIHYSAPDGRIIPFCAYNTGLTFREPVERKFSVPKDQWLNEHPGQKLVEPSSLIQLGKERNI